MALGTVAVFKLKRKLIDNETLRNLHRKMRSDRYNKEILNSQGSQEIDALLNEIVSALLNHNEDYPMFQMVLKEFCNNVRPLVAKNPNFVKAVRVLAEPESTMAFTISWKNQHGEEITNKAWRCNYNSVLGSCRGGVRMHPSVNEDMIVALAFQVTIQNSLSNLPMGGCFMGTDFDARNYSDADVQSFCYEFVYNICKDLPPNWPFDVTCDLGCGPRECAMLARAHARYVEKIRTKRKTLGLSANSQFISAAASVSIDPELELCRKPVAPLVIGRPTSVGIGAIELSKLFCHLPSFDKCVCIVSGAGDCALTVAKCLIEEGAYVTTLSDSSGFIYCPEGLSFMQWQRINQHRVHRIPLRDILSEDGWISSAPTAGGKSPSSSKVAGGKSVVTEGVRWYPGSLWEYGLRAEYVFPCSHELEIELPEAEIMVTHTKPKCVLEISYSACTMDAQFYLLMHKVKIAPGKLCNMAPMVSLGMHLADKMEKAEFEHEIKSYMTYIYNHVSSVYHAYYPDTYFKEAVDCAALLKLAKDMKERNVIA